VRIKRRRARAIAAVAIAIAYDVGCVELRVSQALQGEKSRHVQDVTVDERGTVFKSSKLQMSNMQVADMHCVIICFKNAK
jgi:hypothetical protein